MHLLHVLIDEECDARVTCGDRWLVAKEEALGADIIFTVYEHRKYQKYTRVIEVTPSEDIAANALKGTN